MGFITNILTALQLKTPPAQPAARRRPPARGAVPPRRNFYGAVMGDLYGDWKPSNLSADQQIQRDLATLRARARDLVRNDGYAKHFIGVLKRNTIGPAGIRFQSAVKTANDKPDTAAREKIETAWRDWCRPGNCDVTGKYSFIDIQNIIVETLARDGEVLVRKVRKKEAPFGFQLQLIEADHLDERHFEKKPNGNFVKMGIEFDPDGRPVAYHLFRAHPGDFLYTDISVREKIAVPAADILHLYLPGRISQSRGVPWFHAVLNRSHMLDKYEEAEVVAARVAAAKAGWFRRTEQAGESEYTGDAEDNGQLVTEVEPGMLEELPFGYDFIAYDPQHPTTAYKDYVRQILRGISAGLEVDYHQLANDLESVNYSSIRHSALGNREVYKAIQTFLSEHFHRPVFLGFLEMALLRGKINLPFSKIERFEEGKWIFRGWQWIDPLKETQSNILALQAGLKTASQIAAEQGEDLEEIYAQLKEEKALREKYGISANYDINANGGISQDANPNE